jgi:hypothetical protein
MRPWLLGIVSWKTMRLWRELSFRKANWARLYERVLGAVRDVSRLLRSSTLD